MNLPIFNSAAHPTLSGRWFSTSLDASFSALVREMDVDPGYLGACALGLADIGGYNHSEFISSCRMDSRLIPIAGFNPLNSNSIASDISSIAEYGYKGIKIHPRLYGLDLQKHQSSMVSTFRAAEKLNLTVFLCTYMTSTLENFPREDPFWHLVSILKESPSTRLVLMHGGITRVLQYAELARFNDNILLDLSYTLVKYQGSSVDIDIGYLFRTFDRKICIGTDHPEFTIDQLRAALEQTGKGLPEEKTKNICYKNLLSFLNVTLPLV